MLETSSQPSQALTSFNPHPRRQALPGEVTEARGWAMRCLTSHSDPGLEQSCPLHRLPQVCNLVAPVPSSWISDTRQLGSYWWTIPAHVFSNSTTLHEIKNLSPGKKCFWSIEMMRRHYTVTVICISCVHAKYNKQALCANSPTGKDPTGENSVIFRNKSLTHFRENQYQ